MKHLIAATGLAFTMTFAGPANAAEKTVTLKVDGMTCASCPYMVRKSLIRVDGVKDAKVSLQTRLAVVTFDDARCNVEKLTKATFEAGFPSKLKTAAMNAPSSATTKPAQAMAKEEYRGSN